MSQVEAETKRKQVTFEGEIVDLVEKQQEQEHIKSFANMAEILIRRGLAKERSGGTTNGQ
jgi:hypothetical protein